MKNQALDEFNNEKLFFISYAQVKKIIKKKLYFFNIFSFFVQN